MELYTAPPPGSTVICADELGPVIPRTFPPAPGWSPDGHRIKAPLEYSRGSDKLWVYGGLRIRDEIRMVRPGLYLGRAYVNRAFLLNFTLFNADVAERDGPAFARGEAVAEDCWPGEQRRTTVVR